MFEKLRQLTARQGAVSGAPEYLVVGLGNPGKEYENTRHNAGFMAVDAIAKSMGVKVDRLRFKALTGEGVLAGKKVLLLKPSTYMNLSGQSVGEAVRFYKIPMEKVVVLCDDTTLDVGRVRLRRKGTDGGHNGLKNIIYLSESDTFPRIRIGVGKKPHPDYDLAKWVLGRFTADEQKKIDTICGHAKDMVSLIITGKMEEAMGKYNGFEA